MIRAVLPGYREARAVLRPGEPLPRGGRLTLTLEQEPRITLVCISRPEGADVFVDGERRGQTPLRLVLLFRAV